MRKTTTNTDQRTDERDFIITSAKGGATQRAVKTAKLPTSIDELRALTPTLVSARKLRRRHGSSSV